jgi:hypothetical protein
MPPASAFRHPISQSGTGAFRYRTGSPYSGTGLVPASLFLIIPVPDWLNAGQFNIPAFNKGVHVHTAGGRKRREDSNLAGMSPYISLKIKKRHYEHHMTETQR